MTQAEKIIKIAEACGWKRVQFRGAGNSFLEHPSFPATHYKGERIDPTGPLVCPGPAYVPNYFRDLNAMHEVEVSKDLLWNSEYSWWLGRIVARDRGFDADKLDEFEQAKMGQFANAAQRAEAFGLTFKLWEP